MAAGQWPATVLDLLLAKVVRTYKIEQKYLDLHVSADPFGIADLDVKKPCVRAFNHLNLQQKVAVFVKVYWREVFVPLIAEGNEKKSVIFEMIGFARTRYSTFDMIEAQPEERNALREMNACWEYMELLGDSELGAERQDSLLLAGFTIQWQSSEFR